MYSVVPSLTVWRTMTMHCLNNLAYKRERHQWHTMSIHVVHRQSVFETRPWAYILIFPSCKCTISCLFSIPKSRIASKTCTPTSSLHYYHIHCQRSQTLSTYTFHLGFVAIQLLVLYYLLRIWIVILRL